MNKKFASAITPPYYAVVFTSQLSKHTEGYNKMNEATWKEVQSIKGFLGAESTRDDDGFGITVAYFKNLDAIKEWRNNNLHQAAKEKGKSQWYSQYKIRISKVESQVDFEK